MSAGKEISLICEDESIIKKENGSRITRGDIVQFRTNSGGDIDAMKVLFDISQKDTESKTEHSQELTTVYGRIIKKFSDSVNVQIGEGKAENYSTEKALIYVYDSKLSNKSISLGDASDLQSYENDGGRVFLKIYKDEVKEIVVIK